MDDLMGPSEFSKRTGLSAKALRLYAEAEILVPANVDAVNGYRWYHPAQVGDATTIVLLRGAGVSLADVKRFLDEPREALLSDWERELTGDVRRRRGCLDEVRIRHAWRRGPKVPAEPFEIREIADWDELVRVFDWVGWLHAPRFDSSDERVWSGLERLPADRSLQLVAEANGETVGGCIGFGTDEDGGSTLRAIAVDPKRRRQGIGRALVETYERNAKVLGAKHIALGTDEAVGFWYRLGYTTLLLLQWAFEPELFEDEVVRLESGPLLGFETWRSSFNDVPQLFARLDDPALEVRTAVREAVAGAHVGFCMVKHLTAD